MPITFFGRSWAECIQVVLIVDIIGFLVYASERWIPKAAGYNTAIRWIAAIGTAIWLFYILWPLVGGVLSSGPRIGPRG